MDESRALRVFSFKEQDVRVVEVDGEPWWVAKDVCDVLGLGNPTEALRPLDEDEKSTLRISEGDGGHGGPERNIISESGLYTLILRSNKAEARPFRRWVTHEVLPSLRRNGFYAAGQESRRDKSAVNALLAVIDKQNERVMKLEERLRKLQIRLEEALLEKPTPLPLLCEVNPAPENSPKARQRMRVLHVAEQKPENVPMGEWMQQIAEAEEVSVPTLYRWISEAKDGKILPARAAARFDIHVTVGEINFDSRTRCMSEEAVQWFLNEFAENPDLEVKGTYDRLKELAEEHGWKIGSVHSLYRLCKDFKAAAETSQQEPLRTEEAV